MDITIREGAVQDAEGIAKVHVKSWQSTYRGIAEPEFLDGLSWEDRVEGWKDILQETKQDVLNYVALSPDKVVGFISGGKIREPKGDYDAELYAIYMLPDFQGKGIGKMLMLRFVDWLVLNGYNSLLAWVAEENRYKKFYSTLGGELSPYTGQHKIGHTKHKVVTYTWDSLQKLQNNLAKPM